MIPVIIGRAASREAALNPQIAEIFARLKRVEEELEREIAKARTLRGFSVKNGRIGFDAQASRLHRSLRLGLRYDFSKALGVRGEFERYSGTGDNMLTETDSEMLSVGLSWRF